MTKISIGVVLVAGALIAAACGDNGTTGAGGATATATATTDASSSSSVTTTGTTGTGGAASDLGAPCTGPGECAGGRCVDEMNQGWPGGYCAADCDVATPDCLGTAGVCVALATGMGVCLQRCTQGGSECSAAYACKDLHGDGKLFGCLPACITNLQCPVVGTCDPKQGLCVGPEKDCTNGLDDDGDGLVDCQDPTSCQGTPACAPGATDTGHPCTKPSDCKAKGGDPFCFDEAGQGWPKGSCSEFCDLMAQDCISPSATCVDVGAMNGSGLCAFTCATAADCPTQGYKCSTVTGSDATVCLPACTLDSQCAKFCNTDAGHCTSLDEACSDGVDNDMDGFIDCEDRDCAATCAPKIAMACGAATAAKASSMGDTKAGSDVLAGTCTGYGAHEQVFTFTPGMAGDFGSLSLTLTSASDQGLYVRTTCGDITTELGCSDMNPGGMDEHLSVEVKGGAPVVIVVDGFKAGGEGPFTLGAVFTSSAPLCAAAVAAKLGANLGDTLGGSNAFKGSCTGGGSEERVFSFTPAMSGKLHLVLSSVTDQGLYVRTTCVDASTELGCSDSKPAGMDETLDVQVTGGTPVTVFVDGFSRGEGGPFTLEVSLL